MDQNLIYKSQDQETPQENPCYVPNTNSPNSNPSSFNSAQNIQTPEDPYYSSQSTNDAPPYAAQPYITQQYPTVQNMAILPNQSYYPPQGATPIQSLDPMSNYQLQPGVLNIQPNPQNQNNKSYDLIQHKGIIQTKPDTFHITRDSGKGCISYFCFILGFIGIFISITSRRKEIEKLVISFALGLCFILVGLISSCISNQNAYIILYQNSIGIIKKASCYRKTLVYNLEELERIDFIYQRENNKKNNYFLNIVRKNGNTENICHFISYSRILFTSDEIDYFLYKVNNHIQTKRRV